MTSAESFDAEQNAGKALSFYYQKADVGCFLTIVNRSLEQGCPHPVPEGRCPAGLRWFPASIYMNNFIYPEGKFYVYSLTHVYIKYLF